MKNALKLATALSVCALAIGPVVAEASTPNPTAQAGGPAEGLDPSSVTASAKFTVHRLESEPERLYLYDPSSEKTHVVILSDQTRLTARRKKDFDGRRKLDFDDLAEGQTLKVTFRTDDGRITSIQVLEKAS